MCGSQVTSLLAPAISASALSRSLWLPFGLGTGCLTLIIPCILVLPETRPWCRDDTCQKPVTTRGEAEQSEDGASESSLLLSEDMTASELEENSTQDGSAVEDFQLRHYACGQLRRAKQSFHDLKELTTANPSFSLCLAIFLVTTLSKQSINILLQYTSKRYGVSFAEVSIEIREVVAE